MIPGLRVQHLDSGLVGTVMEISSRRTSDQAVSHVFVEWDDKPDSWDLVPTRAIAHDCGTL